MKDHLRFAVCYWHTWRGTGADPFGEATYSRAWDDGSNSLENAKQRLRVNFAFLKKLGVEYWCFHDRDIAPMGATLAETNRNLDEVVELAAQLQAETGIKLLWGTANLFSHRRYMNGAATSPDANVFAYAAAQVKKAIEVTHRLGGENYVFWGGREGYQSLLNSNMGRELDHLANFFRMAVEHKNKIGFKGQFLIEPKPREPMKHQYDFDVATTICFLKHYKLDEHFKMNIEANHATLAGKTFEHELTVASTMKMLGSIDANTGDPQLGWDTDQFNMDPKSTTAAMLVVLAQGGLQPGGLNFDAKLRRESTNVEDLFIGHIAGMDTFAHGLKIAANILEEGLLPQMLAARYASYNDGIGGKIEAGTTSFEELEQHALHHETAQTASAQQEKFESVFNTYF
eukprot:gnl/Hemi2/24309_TR8170_c0_g1_i1.p1 gnl/Hemi2/24309_TR8170_c0_g1~~gnl/Hemi2/24309_TR8170_c0_g1_i1.p1  ORF type:complete len:450 (-),score=93.06 gnl/Hemi2/24309_TR8170_c0_g1_i1:93-1292(-)